MTAYDELGTVAEMHADCEAAGRNLAPARRRRLERAAAAVGRPAPSLRYEDQPRDVAKRDIEVSAAAARLAGALHLHLD